MSHRTKGIEYYIEKFSKLRKDKSAKDYPATVQHAAPHKPLLLLAVIDRFAEGSALSNLIRLDPELCALFDTYWVRVMPPDWHGDISLPFFHLSGEGFWHLMPRPGSEHILRAGRRLISIRQLHDHTLGASLDVELIALLKDQGERELLRTALIRAHFAPEAHAALLDQGQVNVEAFAYSQRLLEQARQHREARLSGDDALPEPIRDQGFRRAVVKVYNHRCALCGIRVQTADSHTAIDAAHIVPWSVSHNDALSNGMGLCKLCHWTFDKGLIGVSVKYRVMLSPELTTDYNLPGHLITLQEREMIGPQEKLLWPDTAALAWHVENKFRRSA